MKKNAARTLSLIKPDAIFNVLLGLTIFFELFAIGSLSYLGRFNRYLADDYCESVNIRNYSLVGAVVNRYVEGKIRASDRYSNLLFVGLSEMLGDYHLQIVPPLMMFVWLIGLFWSINQFQKLTESPLPTVLNFGMAVSIIFFSAWQASNRFQTFFWRSGMSTHFAPLVFMSLLSGFVLSQINSARKPSLWVFLVVLLSSYFLGGFSEPPTVVALVVISLSLLIVWRWNDSQKRKSALNLLSISLAGFFLAFLTMFLSPGNLSNGTASMTDLPVTFVRTFQFAFDFLVDTFKTLPLPSLMSTLIPFLLFFIFFTNPENEAPLSRSRGRILIWLVMVPLLQYLLIAVSFAPSVHGQSAYPEGRAQFLGRLIMTMAFLVEGALLGVLCAGPVSVTSRRQVVFLLSSLALLILAIYPFRAGMSLLAEVPDYRRWASAWDLRETEIYRSIAMGKRDLVVRWLPTKEDVKEIDGDASHWVNQCAADYYGVKTIRSVPMDSE